MHVCYVIFFSTVCGSDSHTFHIDWISSILWGAHVRTRGWWWLTDVQLNHRGRGTWFRMQLSSYRLLRNWKTALQLSSSSRGVYRKVKMCRKLQFLSHIFLCSGGFICVFTKHTHVFVCVCEWRELFIYSSGGHLIPASQCQVAERTEIVSCSHAHIAAIPGPDRRRESQNAEREEEGSSLRSVSRWPRGPQPGNNGQDGGPSSAISTALLMNFPCWAWETAPQSLHFELVLPLEVIFYS